MRETITVTDTKTVNLLAFTDNVKVYNKITSTVTDIGFTASDVNEILDLVREYGLDIVRAALNLAPVSE